MSTPPPIYRPPPPPRRSTGNLIAIALLIVALIVAGAILALIYGARMISHNITVQERRSATGNKEVSIKTPVGNINVHEGERVDATTVGLPVYPGARQIRDHNAPRVWVNLPGIESLDVVAAHFHTPDPIAKVKDFYQTQLNGQAQLKGESTNFTSKDSGSRFVLEMKRNNQEKVVALKRNGDGTEITLVRVLHGSGEAN